MANIATYTSATTTNQWHPPRSLNRPPGRSSVKFCRGPAAPPQITRACRTHARTHPRMSSCLFGPFAHAPKRWTRDFTQREHNVGGGSQRRMPRAVNHAARPFRRVPAAVPRRAPADSAALAPSRACKHASGSGSLCVAARTQAWWTFVRAPMESTEADCAEQDARGTGPVFNGQ